MFSPCPAKSISVTTYEEGNKAFQYVCQKYPKRQIHLPSSLSGIYQSNQVLDFHEYLVCLQSLLVHQNPKYPRRTFQKRFIDRWYFFSRRTFPTDEVRPVSTSCLCRKSFCRATPRPSSSTPCVSTPSSVDLPASTLPVTATLQVNEIEYCKTVCSWKDSFLFYLTSMKSS